MLCEYILKCYSLSVLFKVPGNCLNIKFFMCHCLNRTCRKAEFLAGGFCWVFSFLNSLKSAFLKNDHVSELILVHSLNSHAMH